MVEYRVVAENIKDGNDPAFRDFQRNISQMLDRGWAPVGGIAVTSLPMPDGSNQILLAQALQKG